MTIVQGFSSNTPILETVCMKLNSLTTVFTASAIALGTLPFDLNTSKAQTRGRTPSNVAVNRTLTGSWVMGAIDSNPKMQQQIGKHGVSVTQNGSQLRIQPVVGFPAMVGQISGQQIRIPLSQQQVVLGSVGNDGNRILLTFPGFDRATGMLVRVGSPGCPHRGNWNSTISECNIAR
jgi:hypothetical protein